VIEQTSCCSPRFPNEPMAGSGRRTVILQAVTLLWMSIECVVSLTAAVKARSLPVAAFGADSFVELLSATVVLMQFGKHLRVRPIHAARVASVLLYLLSVVILALAVLAARWKLVPERSYLGIGITLGALIAMPVLAWLKLKHAKLTKDSALAADAAQSVTCAYLAAVTLLSLLLQTVHPVWWIDSAAIVCLLPLLLREAARAWRGDLCGCC
jgi:divalent metal cation (Fe/Co/Zn/Cd) transporter